MRDVFIVIPCFNEAARLDIRAFNEAIEGDPCLRLVMVDDGSTDGTPTILQALAVRNPRRIQWMRLERNAGKAEAVRLGLRAAMEQGAPRVGFFDADLSTPLREVQPMCDLLEANGALMVLGSRVALLGRHIERSPVRHYAGRIFGTGASLALGMPVYDTQCGAKIFRSCAATRRAFDAPFRSRWIFDVEILARLLSDPDRPRDIHRAFVEYPLTEWLDVGGSKVKPGDFLRGAAELALFAWNHRRARPARGSHAKDGQADSASFADRQAQETPIPALRRARASGA